VERNAVPKPQIIRPTEHRRTRRASRPDVAAPVVAAAKEQDGNTVLKLADRSTITLVGVARLDELTLFGGGLRAIRRVV
jgi:hypothetical protein